MGQDDVRAAIEATNVEFMRLFASGDIAGLVDLYTEDAEFMVPNHEPFVGREAIGAALAGLRGDGASLRLETRQVEGQGPHAWETGRYTVSAGGQDVDAGKYVVVWKLDGGRWRLHRDIINTSRPA